MASYTLSPVWGAGAQLFDNNGDPLSGGKIYVYEAGTTTPATTYTGPSGQVPNSNPIIANSAGRPPNEIWLPIDGSFKFVLRDANDVLIATYDNLPSEPQPPVVNDATSISYATQYTVTSGAFTVGATYQILTVGTTDFVSIGATANLVGVIFTATGPGTGTGTATYVRTVSNKLRDQLSVKDFGVTGDGTDETVEVQAALNALQTGNVKTLDFCGLTILVSSTLYVPSNAKLLGNGATIQCSSTAFVNDGALSGLTSMIANKSAIYTAGEATDINIEISGFTFISGSQIPMDTIYLGNTVNANIHDNKFQYQQAASYTLAHVDCHHSNVNPLVDHNAFYHESTTHSFGACIAFRNSNSSVPSIGLVASNNYLYKSGTANSDEFMWVNGATNVVKGCKIIGNTFVASATDSTASMLTIYPFTGGGASAEAYDTIISNNTFVVPSNVQFGVLIGLSGETRPAYNVIVDANTFEINNNVAVKTLTLTKGSSITNNVCRSLGTTSTFAAGDAAVRAQETLSFRNNVLTGRYQTAFSAGGFVQNNTCEDCEIFSIDSSIVTGNIANKVRYQAVYSAMATAQTIQDNMFVMDTPTGGALPYAFYVAAEAVADIKNNIVRFKTNGFLCLRSDASAAAAAKINFSGNRLYQDGATDKPSFQTFTFKLGGSDNNWLYDRNSNNTPTTGYDVSGFVPAIGHLNMYNDIATGAAVNIGTMVTSAATRTITAAVS